MRADAFRQNEMSDLNSYGEHHWRRRPGRLPAALILLGWLVTSWPAVADMLGRFNTWSSEVNRSLVETVVAPTLAGIRDLPPPVGSALANAYGNLVEPVSTLGWALSGDGAAAGRSAARFAINSTAGVLGVFDVATGLGLPARPKTLSEGVCALGLPPGPILILPGAGPTTATTFLSALALIAGSTWAIAYVSVELALASLGLDIIAGAAALENVARSRAGEAEADGNDRRVEGAAMDEVAAHADWLRAIGCPRA
jgi:phospholipid-binding lipoprotein MlaA